MTFAITGNKPLAFIHVPRTAGRWTVEACQRIGLDVRRCGSQHEPYTDAIQHAPSGSMVFSIVRHPATWLRSWYVSTAAGGWLGWHNHTNVLMDYRADTFDEFAARCAEAPGLLTDIWSGYIPETRPVYILRQESIAHDLVEMLRARGIDFDWRTVIQTDAAQYKSDTPDITDATYTAIYEAERPLYLRFGYSMRPAK